MPGYVQYPAAIWAWALSDAGDSPGERGAVASRRPGPDDPATEEPAILLVGGDENDPIRIRPSARQLHYYRRNPIALPT